MDGLKLVTYCGLYCGLCAQRGRIPHRANALRESMAKEGYEFWGGELPGFKNFWAFLTSLCDPDKSCAGCRQGGGPPFCSIRKCAVNERSIYVSFARNIHVKGCLGSQRVIPPLLRMGREYKRSELKIGLENRRNGRRPDSRTSIFAATLTRFLKNKQLRPPIQAYSFNHREVKYGVSR
ncbi:MAG: DUF3795 domain-containing protein [bacterium]